MNDAILIILALALAASLYRLWQRERRIRELDAAVAALQRFKDEAQRRETEPQIAVEEHTRTVGALQTTIADQKRALQVLQEALDARDQAVRVLQNDCDRQKMLLETAQSALSEREQTLQTTAAELKAAETRIASVAEASGMAKASAVYKLGLALTLANSAYDALLVIDEQRRVIAINDSAETLFGRQRPIGESLLDVTGSPEIESMVDDALGYREETFEEQLTINRRVYRVKVRVIARNGNNFIGLALQDVTELVRLNRARRDMVANISHELRTPIANIRLIIDSIFHEQEKPRGKASRTALKAIARETDSLLWLVQELLDLSMIESGQAILRMVDVPVSLLIGEAAERMTDQSETKNIVIETHAPPDLQVLCDRDQARRVLINLIHNAIKWSPENGVIRVEAAEENDEVVFSVLDQGPGVPDEFRERIFERFYQVDTSRSTGEGTGLGLAICKHIVEAHGGRIWAVGNSQAGGGCFMFTLPGTTHAQAGADAPEFA